MEANKGEADGVGQTPSASVGEMYVVLVTLLDDSSKKKLHFREFEKENGSADRVSRSIIHLETVLLDLKIKGLL